MEHTYNEGKSLTLFDRTICFAKWDTYKVSFPYYSCGSKQCSYFSHALYSS